MSEKESPAGEEEEIVSVWKVVLSRGFLTLFIGYSFACLSFAGVSVGLLVHATEDYGMDAIIVGSIIGTIALIGLIMRPFSAVIVDKFNRKGVLVTAYALLAVSTVGFTYASTYEMMYASQIIRGVSWGLVNCAGYVLLADVCGRANLGVANGFYALGMVVGQSIASAVAVSLGDAIGYEKTFLLAVGMAVIAVLVILTLPYKKLKGEDAAPKKDVSIIAHIKGLRLKDIIAKECVPIMGIGFVFQLCVTALGATYLVKYGRVDLDIVNVGIAATIYNVIMYVSRPVYGRIMDTKGARWCVIPAFVALCLANACAAMATDMTMLYVAAVIYGVGAGGYTIAPRTMAMWRIEKGREAVAASTVGIGNDVGMMLGSVLVPAIAAAAGGFYRNAYWVLAVFAIAGLVYCLVYVYLYLKRNPDNKMRW